MNFNKDDSVRLTKDVCVPLRSTDNGFTDTRIYLKEGMIGVFEMQHPSFGPTKYRVRIEINYGIALSVILANNQFEKRK